jgi:outer membrane protein assembly factor BamB
MNKRKIGKLLYCLLVITAVILFIWQPGLGGRAKAAPLPKEDYWLSFRAGEDNNAVKEIQHVKGPVSLKYWGQMIGELNDWGTNSKSGILVIGQALYFASDDQFYRLDKEGAVTGQVSLEGFVGYSARPVYTGAVIIVPLEGGGLQAIAPDSMETVWLADGPGEWQAGEGSYSLQNTSSLYFYNGLCYSLTLAVDENWESIGGYVQAVNASTGETVWLYKDLPREDGAAGFNMTGSVVMDHWLLVGGEGGDLMVLDAQKGELLHSLPLGAKINSDLVTQGYRVFFTTYDGRLIQSEFDPATKESRLISDTTFALKSNSSPVIFGSKLYVGGLAEYGDWEAGTAATGVLALIDMATLQVAEQHMVEGDLQSSPLLIAGRDDKPYVYFTSNSGSGSLLVLDGSQVKEAFVPEPAEAQFTLFSPVTDQEGTVYYALDSGYLFAIAESVPPPSAEVSSPIIWYMVAAGGLILAGVLAFLVIRAGKKKKS